MSDLSDVQILDLAISTLNEFGPLRFNQIAQDIQRFEAFMRIMKKDRVGFEGGIGLERKLQLTTMGAAKNTGLFATDSINVADTMSSIDIPWRHSVTSYAFERRELLENRSKSKLFDLLESRRSAALVDQAQLMETDFWGKPLDSSDNITPFGLKYWVVKNASEGFNGGNASGFSAGPGNLDSEATGNENWKNYTAQYVNVTKDDLITLMRTAFRKINFVSPTNIRDLRRGSGEQYRLYVNEPTIRQIEDLGEAQNENLGRDIASMDDTMVFKKNPIIWVPELDSDSTNPVYFLNFGYFNPVFLKGDYLRETSPEKVANMHNTMAVFIDTTYNILCTDRRRQAVIATA